MCCTTYMTTHPYQTTDTIPYLGVSRYHKHRELFSYLQGPSVMLPCVASSLQMDYLGIIIYGIVKHLYVHVMYVYRYACAKSYDINKNLQALFNYSFTWKGNMHIIRDIINLRRVKACQFTQVKSRLENCLH